MVETEVRKRSGFFSKQELVVLFGYISSAVIFTTIVLICNKYSRQRKTSEDASSSDWSTFLWDEVSVNGLYDVDRVEEIYEKVKALNFRDQITEMGFTIHEIAPDGNCLFSSIKHQLQLRGDPRCNEDLRKIAVDYMLNNPDDFAPFIEDLTLEVYCERMSKPGVWGDQLELNALSNALQLSIRVFAPFYKPKVFPDTYKGEPHVNISFHPKGYGGEHYNSLLKINT